MEYQFHEGDGTSKREARRIIGEVLGKPLPLSAEVHHVNGCEWNNSNSNLVACESRAYHKLLHIRTRALIACGHANWRKCNHCGEYDSPENLYIAPSNGYCYHPECHRQYNQKH